MSIVKQNETSVVQYFNTLGTVLNKIPSSNKEQPKFCGVFLFIHEKTNMAFIGAGNNLYMNKLSNFSLLRKREHTNSELQIAYNNDKKLKVFFITTPDMCEAYALKQKVLNEFYTKGLLFNQINNSDRNVVKKKIFIDGELYASLSVASKKLCIPKGTLSYRARSMHFTEVRYIL